MAVAAAYKIRHSEFLTWDTDDRDKALWHHIREQQTCRSCGTRPDEWDPEQGGDRHAYVANVDVCRGCQQLEGRRDSMTGDEGRGIHIALARPRPPDLDEPEPGKGVADDGDPPG